MRGGMLCSHMAVLTGRLCLSNGTRCTCPLPLCPPLLRVSGKQSAACPHNNGAMPLCTNAPAMASMTVHIMVSALARVFSVRLTPAALPPPPCFSAGK